MRQSTRVVLNSAFSLAQQLLIILVQVVLLSFVLNRVGSDEYAIGTCGNLPRKGLLQRPKRYVEPQMVSMISRCDSQRTKFRRTPRFSGE